MRFRYPDAEITVTIGDPAALQAAVSARLAEGRGFALATLNLDHLVKLRRDPAFRAAYARHDMVTADGNPVVWLSRLAGRPVSLVTGSDSVVPLARIAARLGRPVSLVGATEAVLSTAAARLCDLAPGLRIGLCVAPPMGFDPEGAAAADIARRLAAVGPGLCLTALSAPKQERFAAFAAPLAPATGFAGIGASLDFLAGTQTRAPAVVRALALEWLWRAATAPRRLVPRYAACAAILPAEVAAALRQRRGG